MQDTPLAAASTAATTHLTTVTIPALGAYWPEQGGHYLGLIRGEDGSPDQHLIEAAELSPEALSWQQATDWAKGLTIDGHSDFTLASRADARLIAANSRRHTERSADWYWLSTQYSRNGAWSADFVDGGQGDTDKSAQLLARAVRRFSR